jgi:hypothetical protein
MISPKSAGESARGAHIQTTRPEDVSSATVRWSLSIASSSMGVASEPAAQSWRSSVSLASSFATSCVSPTRNDAPVAPEPTLMPTSGPCSRSKASSSVTSSPMNSAVPQLSRLRSVSIASPLFVLTTPSSSTILPRLTCTPSHVAGPSSTRFTAGPAISGSALR